MKINVFVRANSFIHPYLLIIGIQQQLHLEA